MEMLQRPGTRRSRCLGSMRSHSALCDVLYAIRRGITGKGYTMKARSGMLGGVVFLVLAASAAPASAAGVGAVARSGPTSNIVHQVQSLCGNWHRECARLHGYQSPNWHACMGQPAAIWDCSGRSRGSRDYDEPDYNRCRTWRRECARLHGRETRNWYACMGQPGARRDCR